MYFIFTLVKRKKIKQKMGNLIARIHQFFIPPVYKENQQEYRKVRILINSTLITTIFTLFYLGNSILFKMPSTLVLMVICAIGFLLNAFLIKWGVQKTIVSNLYVFVATVFTFINCCFSNGLYSFNIVWFALGPVCAVLLGTVRQGWFWLIVSLLCIGVLGILKINGYVFPMEMDLKYRDLMYLNSYIGMVAIIFTVAVVMENAWVFSLRKVEEQNEIIRNEKRRSDELLLNILPMEIVEELKNTGQTVARRYENVTVLFTDFVNFTTVSELLTPEELVKEIDVCFKKFDKIIENCGLEKIKTIGDAYMAVCGLPVKDDLHAEKSVAAAIEIRKFIVEYKKRGGQFDIRIGLHSGSVVAGIVGDKKFAYDIWGDTVNTAARMEQNSEPGKINVSQDTYQLIKNSKSFTFESRGKIEAKNKGAIEMYYLEKA